MMRWFLKLSVIGVTLLTLSACGYRFPGGGTLPGGVEWVAIGIFDNRSAETGVEGIVSNDIIYEFNRNGKNFAYGNQTADATLSGTVLSVSTQSISRESVHNVQERRVTVAISLKMTDSEGAVIWQVSGVSENEAYEVVASKGATEQNKRSAISKLSKRLAEKVFNQMTDNF